MPAARSWPKAATTRSTHSSACTFRRLISRRSRGRCIRSIRSASSRTSATARRLLRPDRNPLTGRPIDLSYAVLRSVSPIHLEYMANMGVLGTMSVSILRGDRLWGLIACHNRAPRHVGHDARQACEMVAQVLAWQIGVMGEAEVTRHGPEGSGHPAPAAERYRTVAGPPRRAGAQQRRAAGADGRLGPVPVRAGRRHHPRPHPARPRRSSSG